MMSRGLSMVVLTHTSMLIQYLHVCRLRTLVYMLRYSTSGSKPSSNM